ncbi:FAD-dependent oxidoreductase [Aeromicrobium sp. CTD01-1L150]|uniref:FAD-dependent oxidoreductase n=1 Tax=Aeromicrobium sp. CTD01-1L150 TaxID=3341830 RepID=UPI0035BF79E1
MPHVVTQACCGDASCVFACPVNCIHPTPDEPAFATAEMLYIDPDSCVDCGACVRACPVGAIKPHTKLGEDDLPFLDLNRMFHAEDQPGLTEPRPSQAPVERLVRLPPGARLRVAVVGSGPAGLYAADELLKQPGVSVTVLDRLPVPHGLVRAGVAPDHQETKGIDRLLRQIEDQPGFDYRLGVEIGRDLTAAELAAHHDAVVYATGASADRRLEVPGEDLSGSETARKFVAWYNGHPDCVDLDVDLSGKRAVVVGNGNVALDVARILATEPERLAGSDIADHALAALRRSAVREVIVLGRRGPAEAAFTVPEIVGLLQREDIDVVVEGVDLDTLEDHPKVSALRAGVTRTPDPSRRRIVLRFMTAPVAVLGRDRATGLRVVPTRLRGLDGRTVAEPVGPESDVEASLVLRSVGYRGEPLPGVPFDQARAVVPNVGGRVLDRVDGDVLPGAYVVGWAKRGPTGFIGTNKSCSQETVNALLLDAAAGRLVPPEQDQRALDALVRSRGAAGIDLSAWRRVDAEERRRGQEQQRPRVKITDVDEVRRVAGPAGGRRRGR